MLLMNSLVTRYASNTVLYHTVSIASDGAMERGYRL